MLRTYYQLTKPGIIYGNMLSGVAGFLLAAVNRRSFNFLSFIGLVIGLSLVIGAACVSNNYLDRDIDKVMRRTRGRALVQHAISNRAALIFASTLGVVGLSILALTTNLFTLLLGVFGFLVYVFAYTFSKRYSVHGTLVGSLSGAVPIVAGYTALSGRFDQAALIIGLILIVWQMPHFYAIALYRFQDYKAAGIPVLPVKKNIASTVFQIRVYILAFIAANISLTIAGYTGYIYAVVMAGFGVVWLYKGRRIKPSQDSALWGKQMFLFSLVVIMVLSIMLPLGAWLP